MTIKIDFSADSVSTPSAEHQARLSSLPLPTFHTSDPDLIQIKKIAKRYAKVKNLIVIGNGGSINNFGAFFLALGSQKKVYLLNTIEPDVIAAIRKQCPPKQSLVIPVSKSGNTVSVLEALLAFANYPVACLTTGNGTLADMAKKMKWQIVEMPDDVGGRFAGRTSCALFPSAILGYDVAKIDVGAQAMYRKCAPPIAFSYNPAKKLALALYTEYQKGYHEIFMPVYSTPLSGFNQLIVQLIHESCGKGGRGHTMYAASAPESQHHTNQRFFGGRKDVLGLFVRQENYVDNVTLKVPKTFSSIPLNDEHLSMLHGLSLKKAMDAEYHGTQADALHHSIPNITITVDTISPHSLGEYLALWQYTAVYLATLFGVNPFDQPQVENSKKISYAMIRKA